MQTLLEVLGKSQAYLEKKGVESSRLDTELLMAHSLDCKRLDLYLKYDQPLESEILDSLRDLIVRRGKREPLQYIIGKTDFYNMTLNTDSRALVPRHETEELIALIVEKQKSPPSKVLDMGTGSGAIALAIAMQFKDAMVTAIDASEDAISLARENASLLSVDNIDPQCVSWTDFKGEGYDLIVANPPYLTNEEWETASPEVKDFEPKGALVAENEGIADLLNIIHLAGDMLAENALLALETGIDHHEKLMSEAKKIGYSKVESKKDLNGHDRFIFAWM